MTHMNFRKTFGAAALIGATLVTANVMADPQQVPYYQGYGMGPGMMGGYGMGPGMMGGYGMGPGMMGGYDFGAALNLTAEQRSQITKIQDELRLKHWELMGKMQREQLQMKELYASDNRDDAALSNSFRKMSELRQEMFDQLLSAQTQVDALLTKEQREILKRP
jgi:Spy/CpxP family protein refolding chaperone